MAQINNLNKENYNNIIFHYMQWIPQSNLSIMSIIIMNQ